MKLHHAFLNYPIDMFAMHNYRTPLTILMIHRDQVYVHFSDMFPINSDIESHSKHEPFLANIFVFGTKSREIRFVNKAQTAEHDEANITSIFGVWNEIFVATPVNEILSDCILKASQIFSNGIRKHFSQPWRVYCS